MLAVVACAIVLVVQARQADQRLQEARAAVARLRADLVKPDVPQQTLDADSLAVQGPAKAAADITSGPLWSIVAHIPVIDHAAVSARGTSQAVNTLATQVLPDLTSAQDQLRSDHLGVKGGIAIGPLRTAAPLLQHASTTTDQVLARMQRLPSDTVISAVDHGRNNLVGQLKDLSGQLHDASDAAQILPGMLGGSGTRTYFIGFENEAESRNLGGLLGAFGILQASNGQLQLIHVGTDSELDGVQADVTFGADFTAAYGRYDPTGVFQNSAVSPNFPDAARIWIGMWKAKTGQSLDGALVIDPTALGALLKITGPTSLPDGTQITGATVADLVERQAYARFGNDPNSAARKQFLKDVAKAAADRLVAAGPAHAAPLARAAAKQIGERRLLAYSAHPAEQQVLAGLPIGGVIPPGTGPGADTGPFLLVATNNAAGGKLDYYLGRTVTYNAAGCFGASLRKSTVTVALHNGAPAGLGVSATGPGYAHDGLPLDTNREVVSFYTTAGALVSGATVDGKQALVTDNVVDGRPLYSTQVNILRGQTTTIVLHLYEPTSAKGPATVVTQPGVIPQQTTVDVPTC